MKFTIGGDPELFCIKDGAPFPSIGLIGGSKKHPIPCKCGALQEDNVLAEFNIDPASDKETWVNNVRTVMQELTNILKNHQVSIKAVSSMIFDEQYLFHPAAAVFGCSPDWNAWTMQKNQPPNPFQAGTLRTASGNIHVGWDLDPEAGRRQQVEMVRFMDLFLGVPSVLYDDEAERRKLYGKAGACRFKPYGVEWRTGSNFWLRNDSLIGWVYDQVETSLNAMQDRMQIPKSIGEAIIHTINTHDKSQAEVIISEYNIQMV